MPDDPRITDMDPMHKMWMFLNWQEDIADEYELSKHNAYISGSFVNPEAVDKLISGEGVHVSTDEEFEETSRMVEKNDLSEFGIFSNNIEEEKPARKRKRKLLNN